MKKRRRRRRGGFTLIELLVVVTILGLIAGVIGVSVQSSFVDAQKDTTKLQLKKIEEALDYYRIKHHRFPTTTEGLAILRTPPKGEPVLREVPADPWGKAYVYLYPSSDNPKRFELYSLGPDGASQTEDDIR